MFLVLEVGREEFGREPWRIALSRQPNSVVLGRKNWLLVASMDGRRVQTLLLSTTVMNFKVLTSIHHKHDRAPASGCVAPCCG